MRQVAFISGLWLASLGAGQSQAQSSPPPLPAEAVRYALLSPLGAYGEAANWTTPDGRKLWLETTGRGAARVQTLESVRLGADGMPAALTVQKLGVAGEPDESFEVVGEGFRWKGPSDARQGAYAKPAFYVASAAPSLGAAQLLLETILRAPDHNLPLLPDGRARADKLASIQVGAGARRRAVSLWLISGVGISPIPLWSTPDNRFFASLDMPTAVPAGFTPNIVPAGYEDALPALQAAQDRAMAAHGAQLARRLVGAQPESIAFTKVRAFVDGRFLDDQTVVVAKGRILAVGPAGDIAVPRGAKRVDGAGKTLLPGLWDYHRHVEDDATGPFMLSLGVTSIRDPSNDNAKTKDRWRRWAKGELLGPHVYASALIDGEGPNSTKARTSWIRFGDVVDSQAEALAAVRRAKAAGFSGVKFYGSINRDWVGPTIAEAHRLGMRAHGHLPSGWRPSRAIEGGYDEITHGYFMMLEAMPDSVVSTSETRSRFVGPAQYGKDVDLSAAPMAGLAALMARRHISADPTLVVVEWLFTAENRALSPAYQAYAGTAPPMMQRRFRLGFAAPSAIPGGRKSFQRMIEMVGRFHRAGVTIAAGTDSSGLELVRELEFYVQAGFTPAEAIEAATIVPATLLGVAKDTGSIAVGKRADLVLVEGDPSRRIGDLRNTRLVVAEGRLLDADALRAASSFSGRPATSSP
jgi:hypothetical protein